MMLLRPKKPTLVPSISEDHGFLCTSANVSRETGASDGPPIPQIGLPLVRRSRQSLGSAAISPAAIDWAVAYTANTRACRLNAPFGLEP